ncbi:ABC transporter permease [Fictibacillus gelatini]|uniref:ABC transporter permease n=1 Tax=Fictibacillus gelatini TaxID=225985 RepID=UPI0003F8CB5A|nr:ABC transporter permease [Fictibacillus gelatini]
MTAKEWYDKRKRKEKQFQKKVFGMVLDWSVYAYYVIPVGLIFAFLYVGFWTSPPKWITHVSPIIVFVFFYSLTMFNHVRTYIAPADELFFLQREEMYSEFIALGKWQAVRRSLVGCLILLFIFLPLLVKGLSYTYQEVLALALYLYLWNVYQMLIRRWALLRGWKWKYRFLVYLFFGLFIAGLFLQTTGTVYSFIFYLYPAVVSFLLMKREPHPKRYFSRELEMEQEEKWKWANMIMVRSGAMEKPVKVRKYPPFNRTSKPLYHNRYPANVLVETFIKWMYRSGEDIKLYLYFLYIASFAIIVTPYAIKWLIFPGIVGLLYMLSKSIWTSFMNHRFNRHYPFQEKVVWQAKRKARFWTVAVPSICCLALMSICYLIKMILLN